MKKKWILLGILFIILIIAITAFVSIKIYSSNSDEEWNIVNTSASSEDDDKDAIKELELEVQAVYKNSIIYTSANEKILVLELKNCNNDNISKLTQILDIIEEKAKEFKTYNKLITRAYFNDESGMYMEDEIILSNFERQESKKFVNYDDFEKLYNDYKNVMDTIKNY